MQLILDPHGYRFANPILQPQQSTVASRNDLSQVSLLSPFPFLPRLPLFPLIHPILLFIPIIRLDSSCHRGKVGDGSHKLHDRIDFYCVDPRN